MCGNIHSSQWSFESSFFRGDFKGESLPSKSKLFCDFFYCLFWDTAFLLEGHCCLLDLLALECLEHPDMWLVVLCEETLDLSETETGESWVNSAVNWVFFVESVFVGNNMVDTVLAGNNFLQQSKNKSKMEQVRWGWTRCMAMNFWNNPKKGIS